MVLFTVFVNVQFSNSLHTCYLNLSLFLPLFAFKLEWHLIFLSCKYALKLQPCLLVSFLFTTETLKSVKQHSLNHNDGLQVSGGVEKTIYRGRTMMQIVAPIWKIKLREAAEIIRERRKKTRLNTQCTRKIGHFLSTNLESENTDSLRRSTRIRGWWSSAAWLENQVVRLGVGCTWAQQMALSVECWKTDERVNSLRLALGSSVQCQEWERTLPQTQKICKGETFLMSNVLLNLMLVLSMQSSISPPCINKQICYIHVRCYIFLTLPLVPAY